MEILYIVIPAYNEEENIRKVIQQWHTIVDRHNGRGASKLVVIDDGSKDQTYSIMTKMKEEFPYLLPLMKENGGHGDTVLYGYQFALKQNADFIFQTDSDGQTDPAEFEEFWNGRKQYDMLIGHRCEREDGYDRVFVTLVLKVVLKLCFGVKITDANTPYRLMKASVLKKYISMIPAHFNLSNVLISVIYAKKKRSVKYIPITFHQRQGGVNSINFIKICKIGRQAVVDFIKIKKMI